MLAIYHNHPFRSSPEGGPNASFSVRFTVLGWYIQHSLSGMICVEIEPDEETAMTPLQPVLFAASLFLALTSLLRWTHRREVTKRLQRSLQAYLTKRSPEITLSVGPHLETV